MSEKIDKLLEEKSKLNISHDCFGYPIFEEPKYNVNCKKCGVLYKSEDTKRPWETKREYNGLFRDCYIELINKCPSDEQIREWAEEVIEQRIPGFGIEDRIPYDCNSDNFFQKVKPMISVILEEREEKKRREFHEAMLGEASKIINKVRESQCKPRPDNTESTIVSYKFLEEVVAYLLEKMDNLENKIPPRDILHEPFTI